MRVRFLLFVSCTLACRLHFDDTSATGADGQTAAFVPEWKSGTRFRARLWASTEGGGDPIFAGWRDTQLDTDCQNTQAADGLERCLPIHLLADTYYADAACTQPVAVRFNSPCGLDRYATTTDVQLRHHIFKVGTPLVGPVYDGRGGGCSPYTPPAGSTIYTVSSVEESPAQFATVSYYYQNVGLHQHIVQTLGDGSTYELTAISGTTVSCNPTGGLLGATQCRPSGIPVATPVYRESTCTQRGYLADSGATQLIVDKPSMCGVPYQAYQVTGATGTTTYFVKDAFGCNAMSAPAGHSVYSAMEIPDPYPTGTTAPGPRRGRLGRLYWTADDDPSTVFSIATWDHDLNRSCFPFIAEDGVFRCLPRRPKLVDAFESNTCSGTSQSLAASCYHIDPLDGPYYPSCEDGPWAVKRMPSAPLAAIMQEGTCTTLPAPDGVFEHDTGTTTVPASTFSELVEMIE